jgi:hypothetical protein
MVNKALASILRICALLKFRNGIPEGVSGMTRLMVGLAAAAAVLTMPAAGVAQAAGSGGSGWWNQHHGGHGGGSGGGSGGTISIRKGGFSGNGDARLRGRSPDGAWGYYEGDYDANRSFDPDKWNDWWHERTDRSYPRWVQEGSVDGTCEPSRMWWSGAGWHC